MATHDYIISNASGAAVRADLNNALAAIATNNSSATEPTTTYAYQWWADTGSSPTVMKLRNAANSGWITLFQLDGEWTVVPFENGTAAAPSIYFKDSGTDTGIYSPGTDQVAITTGGTQRATVDSSGRLLVGTSTARSVYAGSTATTPKNQFEFNANSYNSGVSLINYSNTGFSPVLTMGLSQSGTQGTNTALNSGTDLGLINFVGNDGTNFRSGAYILASADAAYSAGSAPTRLSLWTTASGASSPTERMRLDSNGILSTYCAANTDCLFVSNATGAGTSRYLIRGRHGATGVGGGTESFSIFTNGNVQNTNNSYTAISDIKLKENIVDAGSQWDDLKALRVRNYNLKDGQTHRQIGLIAQEVEPISPGLVYESPDRDEDGNDLGTVTKSVNYSVLYMKAVKALQEAMERIEQLEAKVSVLESKP